MNKIRKEAIRNKMKRFLLLCGLCLTISPLYACGNVDDTGKSEIVEFSDLSGNTNNKDAEDNIQSELPSNDSIEDTTKDTADKNQEEITSTSNNAESEKTENVASTDGSRDTPSDVPTVETPNVDTSQKTDETLDPYVGEYNDYDANEPNLKIQKNDDGTYSIQIGIFRLVQMDDCIGYEKDGRIEFSVNDWEWGDNGKISGTITLEEDIATVKFITGWNEGIDEYKYYR